MPIMAIDVELEQGQQWIEREFWSSLPGREDKPENKIEWNFDSNRRLYTMRVEIDGKQGRCQFTENQLRDCLADRSGTVQKKIREALRVIQFVVRE